MAHAGRKLARQRREDGGLHGREGRIVIGGCEMRHHPGQPQRAIPAGELASHGERIGRRHAPAAHAGVGLDVHGARHAGAAQPGVRLQRRHHDLEPPGLDFLTGLQRREHDDRRAPSESLAQLARLLERRAADALGPCRERRPGALDGAMPVTVGLDHGPQAAAVPGLDQPPRVRVHGAEVDLERRAPHASRRPSGTSRSVATIPPASETARRAAEPCATAASASACRGLQTARAQRADGACEDVAGTGRRELGHGRLDHAQRLPVVGDERVGALEQDRRARRARPPR